MSVTDDSVSVPVAEGAISESDCSAIIAAATDYIAAWLDGDPARMARCLHPRLVKRSVEFVDGQPSVDEMSREDMVTATAHRKIDGTYELTLLHAYGDIATVKIVSPKYVDYLQIARFADRWLLLNVLWQARVAA